MEMAIFNSQELYNMRPITGFLRAFGRQVLWPKKWFKGRDRRRLERSFRGWLIRGYTVVIVVLILLCFFQLVKLFKWIYNWKFDRKKKEQGKIRSSFIIRETYEIRGRNYMKYSQKEGKFSGTHLGTDL